MLIGFILRSQWEHAYIRANKRTRISISLKLWTLIGPRARANEGTPNSDAQIWKLIRTSPASAGEGRSFWPSWVKSSVGSVCQTLGCYHQQWWQTASSVENDCFPSHVKENTHFLHCWLFDITADSSNLVFNKQNQQCICHQSWSRKWAKN